MTLNLHITHLLLVFKMAVVEDGGVSTSVLGLTFRELLNLSRSSDFGFTKKTISA